MCETVCERGELSDVALGSICARLAAGSGIAPRLGLDRPFHNHDHMI